LRFARLEVAYASSLRDKKRKLEAYATLEISQFIIERFYKGLKKLR